MSSSVEKEERGAILKAAEGQIRLTPVDREVLAALDAGKEADSYIEDVQELNEREDLTVNPEVLKWLCSRPISLLHTFPRVIRIRGYRFRRELDLQSLIIPFKISLSSCLFDEGINLRHSSVPGLKLAGSLTSGLDGDGLTISGTLSMTDGFVSRSTVCLSRATIKGDLMCAGGKFSYNAGNIPPHSSESCRDCHSRLQSSYSLILEKATIGGSLYVCGGFSATGGLLLCDAKVGGNVNATAGILVARMNGKGRGNSSRRIDCDTGEDCHRACALNGEGMHVGGSLLLNKAKISGETRLMGATVEGDVEAARASFVHPGADAISAERLRVRGNVTFDNEFKTEGAVQLQRAEIAMDLVFVDGKLTHEKEKVLCCEGIRLRGSLKLNAVTADGMVDLANALVGGHIDCKKSTFRNPGAVAFNAHHCEVGGSLFLSCETIGRLYLAHAKIAGGVDCQYGRFRENDGATTFTFNAEGVSVEGTVGMTEAIIGGGVQLDDAYIGSCLTCSGGEFSPAVDQGELVAISARRVHVGGSIYLDERFKATGEVRLKDACIEKNVLGKNGTITNAAGFALQAPRVKVGGCIHLNDGFSATGRVTFRNGSIGADLLCAGGRFCSPAGIPPQKGPKDETHALNVEGARIGGSVLLRDGFRASGSVCLRSAHVGRYLVLTLAAAENMWDMELDLTCAKAETLKDDPKSWPGRPNALSLDGFEYKILESPHLEERLKTWLDKRSHFHSQPYEQLASVLRNSGYEDMAKKVLIHKNEALLMKRPWQKEETASGDAERGSGAGDVNDPWKKRLWRRCTHHSLRYGSWFWRLILGWTVRYGYRPFLALAWGALVVFIGAVLFYYGMEEGVMKPTKDAQYMLMNLSDVQETCLGINTLNRNAFLSGIYSLDTFLPLIDLKVGDYFVPAMVSASCVDQHAPLWLTKILPVYHGFLILAGWIITSLFVAAMGGIVRK